VTWTRVTDVDEAATFLPAWIGRRLAGLHGRFGLLLTTGDVLRITSIGAVHHSSDGVILVDVSLDNAGVPEGADLAWRSKHFLGMPVPGATMATVNLAHVVATVEFLASLTVDSPGARDAPTSAEVVSEMSRMADEVSNATPASSEASLPSNVKGGVAQLGESPPPIEMIAAASSGEPIKKGSVAISVLVSKSTAAFGLGGVQFQRGRTSRASASSIG
jgi:hypothetical protein